MEMVVLVAVCEDECDKALFPRVVNDVWSFDGDCQHIPSKQEVEKSVVACWWELFMVRKKVKIFPNGCLMFICVSSF